MNELVRKIQAHDREGFIALFRKLDATERFGVLNQQTSDGKTLLHYSAESGDLELVRHLLGLEIQLDIRDVAQKTAADLAEQSGYQEIAVLLKSRMEWGAKNTSRLPLNKALNLIEGSYHAIEGGKNKPLVLVLGETGVGKSTLINYLNGAKYRLTGIAGFSQATELMSGVDIAQVGHNPVVSETLYPQVLSVDCGNDVLDMADLAGINGTREPVVELAGTVSTHLLSKIASAIKSILFVVDMSSLKAGRGGAFQQTIKTLNKILQGDFESKTNRSVFFAITKLPPGVIVDDVVKTYLAPLKKHLEGQVLQGCLNHEDVEMYHTVKLMISAKERIFAPDVCDVGQSRKELFKALVNSPEISAKNLDLLHMDKHQESFIEMLTFLSGEYLHLSDEVRKHMPSQLEACEKTVSENMNNIKNWEAEMADAKKAQEEGMTPEKAIQMMTERQASLKILEKKYAQLTEERTRLNVSRDITQAFIKDIDVDTAVEYGAPYRFNHIGELQIIQSTQSNPAPSTIGKEIGSKVGTAIAVANPVVGMFKFWVWYLTHSKHEIYLLRK
jgi:energy-coupling factor transporter ATP-binding protein EcfA2